MSLTVSQGGERLDKYISNHTDFSRARAQTLISCGSVWVNGKEAKKNTVLNLGDIISIEYEEETGPVFAAEQIPLDIVYEDEDICVVNKPQGMVVHPAAGNFSGTLVNALMAHFDKLSDLGGTDRPGIVHRLDKMTSGLLVIAKNNAAHENLAKQFALHTANRRYLALVHGNLKQDFGTVSANIGRHPNDRTRMAVTLEGKEATTHWRVLERFGSITLLELRLETGRTHQIRVHMAHIKHPVLGDEVYSGSDKRSRLKGQILHGYRLELDHPVTGQKCVFLSPIPDYFQQELMRLNSTFSWKEEIGL
ncbi:MAG: RluA family pseudouridine synthase [Clostridia bacterium]|nr:RluA family pseudouridine synthase [Clostridia bacterium]